MGTKTQKFILALSAFRTSLINRILDLLECRMPFDNAQNIDARYGVFINTISESRPHAVSARFDGQERQPCLKGTRVEILNNVCYWIHNRDARRIYWINGLAGTGKTTIAYTVAKICKDLGILGASFFCSRFDAHCRNPRLVFITLADQLGQFFAPFKEQITRAHISDPGLKYSNVSNQLEELIVKPLRALQNGFPPCVIILDALDECKDDDTTSVILSSLSQHIKSLTPLKFLVTSRPEQKISGPFRLPILQHVTQHFNLHEVKLDVVEHDIELYLISRLMDVGLQWGLEDGWPATADISALARLSSGLFIFATTAVKFIVDPNYSDPRHQLAHLLATKAIGDAGSPYQLLDQLYMEVLVVAYPHISEDHSVNLRMILGTIALLQHPLHTADIEQLLVLEPCKVLTTTKHLGAVLSIVNERICLVHPSFFEFITDPARCVDRRFVVDSEAHHARLSCACLRAMSALRRDICQIEDSSLLNSEVRDPALADRIALHIPPYLQYACRSWAYHFSLARVSDIPLEILMEFCSKRLLYWVEVCSLLGELRNAIVGLDGVCQLLSNITAASEALELLSDCQRFIREFFDPISIASLHIYHSALPFTPTQTAIRTKHSHEMKDSVTVHSGVKRHWDPCLRTISGCSKYVKNVAVSPDGKSVASGSNEAVQLWDFLTGAHLQTFYVDKYTGSVAFSRSGDWIGCGSGPCVILWDTASGARIAELRGHTQDITSVAFSPSVDHIASASRDRTIRIWDTTSGARLRMLQIPSRCSSPSIAYSPNGAHITSGDDWGTIRIWEAVSGNCLKEMLCETDRFEVLSVAYSPNGTHIASGDEHSTIRIWDIVNGVLSGVLTWDDEMFIHGSWVYSVAYSPDGVHIITASSDHTIRIWDATSGIRLKTLKGHTDGVCSVAHHPVGTKIVSASGDETIRIWDYDHISVTSLCEETGLFKTFANSYQCCDTHEAVCASRIATYRYDDHACISEFDLWDASGTHQFEITEPPGLRPDCIAISYDGAFVAAADHFTHIIHIYSGFTGACVQSLNEGCGYTSSLVFSRNGALASGTEDGTIRIWHPHLLPRALRSQTSMICNISFSLDGIYIVSASGDRNISLWSVLAGSELARFYCENPLDHIYISGDHRFIMGLTSLPAIARILFPTPGELWQKEKISTANSLEHFDALNLHTDGWLYSEEQEPRRRICWVPVDSRPIRIRSEEWFDDNRSMHWIQNVYVTQSGTVGHITTIRTNGA